MYIQLRESDNNKKINNKKEIEIRIQDVAVCDKVQTSLRFDVLSSPAGGNNVLHSNDTEGTVFLGYSAEFPIMNITLPTEGTYSIKVIAEVTEIDNNAEIVTTSIDADGNLVETTSIGPIGVSTSIESSAITLVYDATQNEWM